jgi:hypothetical protein
MTTSKRYLFAIIDGGGTVPADTSVIRALVARGHDVRVLADRVLAPDVESTGAEHIPWTRAPQRPDLDPKSVIINDWDAKTPSEAFARVRDGAMVGPADLFAADVRAELQRRPADAVVANFFVFGAQIAAEAEGVPFAFLVSNILSFPTSNTPPLGPGLKPARGPLGRARDAALNRLMARLFDKGLGRLNEVRRENGLEPIDSVLQNFERADRLLLLTSRAFEYEQFSPPPNVRITGPRLDDPAWAGDWTPPAGDAPLVLVGMSSTFMDHGDVLQRATTALGELPVRGSRHHRPRDPRGVDRRARERDAGRARAAQRGAAPRLGGRDPRRPRNGDQVARSRCAGRGAAAGPRPARQRGARRASRRRPEAEAEGVQRRDRRRGPARPRRALVRGRRTPDRRRDRRRDGSRSGGRGARGAGGGAAGV